MQDEDLVIKRRENAGFTLIELSIVIIIIALVAGMGLVATMGAMESARVAQTINKMDVIEEALMEFRNQYNRLPCPANQAAIIGSSAYGQEDRTAYGCGSAYGVSATPYAITNTAGPTIGAVSRVGTVPTVALNLPAEFMYDGWGRRFNYAIDHQAGMDNAFDFIPPAANNCSISVLSASGSYKSSGAIYALVSHGKDGHGAFNAAGVRAVNTSSNTHTLYNCQCSALGVYTAPTQVRFVDKEIIESVTAAQQYDDYTRWKDRFSLQNDTDRVRNAYYREYEMAVAYNNTATYYLFKRGCQGWMALSSPASPSTGSGGTPIIRIAMRSHVTAEPFTDADLDSTFDVGSEAYVDINGNGFWDGDSSILVFSYSIVSSFRCMFFNTIGKKLAVYFGDNASLITCPANTASSVMAVSNNDYVAISSGVANYINLYRWKGMQATPIVTPLNPLLTSQPSRIAFSRNAEMMLVANSSYATVYLRTDESTFKAIHADHQPISASTCTAYSNISSVAFSPDGNYLAVGCASTTPAIKVWKIGSGTPFIGTVSGGTSPFTTLNPADMAALIFPGSAGPQIAFSDDSRYLAGAGGTVTASGPSADNVFIFSIDDDDNFISTPPIGSYTGTGATSVTPISTTPIAFSPDGNYLMVAVTLPTGSAIAQFRKLRDGQYMLVTSSASTAGAPFYNASPRYPVWIEFNRY